MYSAPADTAMNDTNLLLAKRQTKVNHTPSEMYNSTMHTGTVQRELLLGADQEGPPEEGHLSRDLRDEVEECFSWRTQQDTGSETGDNVVPLKQGRDQPAKLQ